MTVAEGEGLIRSRPLAWIVEAAATRPLDVVIPLGIFAGASTLYVRTMTPGLGGGIDSAEFQHAAYDLSIVHPTGYPLYLLLTRVFIAFVPFGEVAWRVNLLSALFCAAAIALVYLITKELSGSRLAGVFAAGLAATHPLIWQQATIAEVNSLNLLLIAALMYALLRWARESPDERGPPLEVAGLLLGLALANHRVSLLALPGVILFIAWAVRDGRRLSLVGAARTVGATLLPLLLYL
ncbi:MAG: glycosyltransferase family 117 protein, partial [Vicinamibacterales bacterium]